jgi:hypothetical protein
MKMILKLFDLAKIKLILSLVIKMVKNKVDLDRKDYHSLRRYDRI